METTIQLEMRTVQTLKILKEEMGANSYNEVILKLIPKKLPKSMLGCAPELRPFTEKDRMEDRNI
jgi:predicted CopG family antitoxin